jgi:glycosyltransferase involved in cell wall biosynthesis
MNLIFVHGHKFRNVNGKIYSPGGLQENILNRYVDWFGNVTVIGRIIMENETKTNYSEISNPMIKVVDNSGLEDFVKASDVLIVRLPSVNGYKAVALAKKNKKPYLIEAVACIWDAYWNYGIKGKVVAFPAMTIMKNCIKYAPYVVYVSQEFLQRRYPTDGKNVGISDVELMKMKEDVLTARLNKIKKSEGNKLILGTTAAVDVPHKGQEYIIRAIPQIIKATGMDIEYQLVGGGSNKRLFSIAKECHVEDKIKFIGFLNHDKVFEWLDNIDIYIQPSFQEGLCRALVEAMSRGLPCAVSAVGGNPELIDNKYIFSMKNKKMISKLITCAVTALSKEKVMLEEAKHNFGHAQTTFEKDMLDKKRNEFYLEFRNEVNKNA